MVHQIFAVDVDCGFHVGGGCVNDIGGGGGLGGGDNFLGGYLG